MHLIVLTGLLPNPHIWIDNKNKKNSPCSVPSGCSLWTNCVIYVSCLYLYCFSNDFKHQQHKGTPTVSQTHKLPIGVIYYSFPPDAHFHISTRRSWWLHQRIVSWKTTEVVGGWSPNFWGGAYRCGLCRHIIHLHLANLWPRPLSASNPKRLSWVAVSLESLWGPRARPRI